MTEKEKMIQGMLYDAGDPELQRENAYARDIVVQASQISDNKTRSELYKKIIKKKFVFSF